VVLAGNVQLGGALPKLAQTVLPVSGYVAVTEPLGDRLSEAITYRGAVSDTRLVDNHYRIVGGDRLMWAGGCTAWEANAGREAAGLRKSLAAIYPQLGPVEFSHTWAGTVGVAVHRMPQIGEISPGLWVASALGEHGINTSAVAGNLIARAIVDGDDMWKLFLPYDLVWTGGAAGRAIVQARTWWLRKAEAVAARSARRREARQVAEDDMESAPAEGP
jgi:glycine/D-amino acid oxidase-like deaminating enzyme